MDQSHEALADAETRLRRSSKSGDGIEDHTHVDEHHGELAARRQADDEQAFPRCDLRIELVEVERDITLLLPEIERQRDDADGDGNRARKTCTGDAKM